MAPELRRITTCSHSVHEHVVHPIWGWWLHVSIPGRSMCSTLLILSKGAPLPRVAATVDSRLMALPPPPSPHSPDEHVVHPIWGWWLHVSIPGRSMCSTLLILSKGAPLPRVAATVDSRLMAPPPPPSPHSPDHHVLAFRNSVHPSASRASTLNE